PMPPAPPVEGAVSTDTTIRWNGVPGADHYIIRWRRTDASQWTESLPYIAPLHNCATPDCAAERLRERSTTLPRIRVDDWVFGVSSVAADGSESPVASAVPGGAFGPYVPPPPAQPQ
ncbi:MAG TPA: peptidase M28, partial [Allosphingosinicella sp.]|nr:peptidase M28 [Allosphingosinicella sp.]